MVESKNLDLQSNSRSTKKITNANDEYLHSLNFNIVQYNYDNAIEGTLKNTPDQITRHDRSPNVQLVKPQSPNTSRSPPTFQPQSNTSKSNKYISFDTDSTCNF